MKQHVKRRLAALLSVSMVTGLTIPAYADQTSASKPKMYNVTIENVPGGYILAGYLFEDEDGITRSSILPIGETISLPENSSIYLLPSFLQTDDFSVDFLNYRINGEPAYPNGGGASEGYVHEYGFELSSDTVVSADFMGYRILSSRNDPRSNPYNISLGDLAYPVGTKTFQLYHYADKDTYEKLPEMYHYDESDINKENPILNEITVSLVRYSEYPFSMYNYGKTLDKNTFSINHGQLYANQDLQPGMYEVSYYYKYNETDKYTSGSISFHYGYSLTADIPIARYGDNLLTANAAGYVESSTSLNIDPKKQPIDYLSNFAEYAQLKGHAFAGFTTDDGTVVEKQTIGDLLKDSSHLNLHATYEGYTPVEIPTPDFWKNGWNQFKDHLYYYAEDSENVLLFGSSGLLYNTIIQDNGNTLYYVSGSGALASSGITEFDGYWYSSPASYGGELAENVSKAMDQANEFAFYTNDKGELQKGFIQTDKGLMYADENYLLVHNAFVKVNGDLYFFKEDYLADAEGFSTITDKHGNEDRYYFRPDGRALTGWQFIEDNGSLNLYHFKSNGVLETDTTVCYNGYDYIIDENGVAQPQISDKQLDAIASPSNSNNAAKSAKMAVESINDTKTEISQEVYSSKEDAESFLQRLIDFFLEPIQDEAMNALVASESDAIYTAPEAGTADTPDGTDGSIRKDFTFYHYIGNDDAYIETASASDAHKNVYTATASVAVKIKATPYATPSTPEPEKPEPDKPGTEEPKPDPDKPDQPNPEKPNPDKPGTNEPDPDQPSKPDTPDKNHGGSTIGGSGSGSSSSGSRSSVSTQATSGSAAGRPETPGAWFFNAFGQWQLLDPNGIPYKDTWVVRNGHWYYVNTEGIMLITWQFLGGKWYYFTVNASEEHPAGSLLTNTTTPDGYKVGADGAWIQ